MLVLALRERASKESVVEEKVVEQQGDLAVWLQQRFNGYFTVLVKIISLTFEADSDTFSMPAGKEEKEYILLHSNFYNKLLINSTSLEENKIQCNVDHLTLHRQNFSRTFSLFNSS